MENDNPGNILFRLLWSLQKKVISFCPSPMNKAVTVLISYIIRFSTCLNFGVVESE